MLYSNAWLETLVPHARSADAVRELIGRHVATVDDVRRLREDLSDIVIGRVVQAGRHPNSDHLWVTKVDDGSGELLSVVCGAPNVIEGTLYPFARVGVTLPGGITLDKRKIRGETSQGMLCSARELGLGADHEGILALDVDATPGQSFMDVVQVGDVQFDVDVLPNRPDLLSHLGMARELSALTGTPIRAVDDIVRVELGTAESAPPVIPVRFVSAESEGRLGEVTVRIDDAVGCRRLLAAVIRGISVGPSPDWLVQRLDAAGLRTISNVVDITNYVMYTCGQPMHAYDLNALSGARLVARAASAGERLKTLDGTDRTLTAGMLVIADAAAPIGVAGVMGGELSEVSEKTTDLILEVADFEPKGVRQTRKALGVSSDAAYRFERGVDPAGQEYAITLAIQLICAVANGSLDGDVLSVGRRPTLPAPVTLAVARTSKLLGMSVTAEQITQHLTGIGFEVAPSGDDLRVTPPSWRGDVSRDADLLEEVARLIGYDALPDTLRPARPGTVPDHPLHMTSRKLRDVLVGQGLFEARPLPFVRGDDTTHVRVLNPLADDEPHLRTSILETLSRRAEYNLSRREGNVRLFEIGSVFAPVPGHALPAESLAAGAVLMGARRPVHFTEPRPPSFDQWDAKWLGERMAESVHGPVIAEVADGDVLWYLMHDGKKIGRVVRLALDKPVWASDAFGIEVTCGSMDNGDVARGAEVEPGGARQHVQYRDLPVTPPAVFDLALLLPVDQPAAEVERVIQQSGGDTLESLVLFDEFVGSGADGEVPTGQRSVAWRLTFRDPKRTLRDKEVEGRRSKILQALERELNVRPRSG